MRTTQAHIDLTALQWNLEAVQRRTDGARLLGMVKANAYGHGIIQIAQALSDLGVHMLGTAYLGEARELRSCGIQTEIIILTPTEANEAEEVARHQFHVVACDIDQMQLISDAACAQGTTVPVHLYIDTGMMREGFRSTEAVAAAEQLSKMPGLRLVGVCTHFATADDPTSPFLHQQLTAFESAIDQLTVAGFSFEYVHAANSGALWMSRSTHFTMVRTGLSLYGYAIGAETDVALRPVLSLRSTIISKRKAWPGESISYGQRYIVTEECTIVTVPIGYGDGYLRGLTGHAECIINGRKYPVVGSICMDELMVNIGAEDYPVGQEVVLLGAQSASNGEFAAIDAIELAEKAGTIPYEILTAISARVPRVYHGGTARPTDTITTESPNV
jgi:alanine racemase